MNDQVFCVTKEHRFKGNYWRWFEIKNGVVRTLDPSNDTVTNEWPLRGVSVDPEDKLRFNIEVAGEGGLFSGTTQTISFKSICRSDLVAALRHKFSSVVKVSVKKSDGSETKLKIDSLGIHEGDGQTHRFVDLHSVERLKNGGIIVCVGFQGTPHLYAIADDKEMWDAIRMHSRANGVKLRVAKSDFDPSLYSKRLQMYLDEFPVEGSLHVEVKQDDNVASVSLSKKGIAELDCTGRPLRFYLAARLLRIQYGENNITLYFHSETVSRTYQGNRLDVIAAYLWDVCSQIKDSRVEMVNAPRNKHGKVPTRFNIPPEIESTYLKRFVASLGKLSNWEEDSNAVLDSANDLLVNSSPRLNSRTTDVCIEDFSGKQVLSKMLLFFPKKPDALLVWLQVLNRVIRNVPVQLSKLSYSAFELLQQALSFKDDPLIIHETCLALVSLCLTLIPERKQIEVENIQVLLNNSTLFDIAQLVGHKIALVRLSATAVVGRIILSDVLQLKLQEALAKTDTQIVKAMIPSINAVSTTFYVSGIINWIENRTWIQNKCFSSGILLHVLHEAIFGLEIRKFACRSVVKQLMRGNIQGRSLLKRIVPKGMYQLLYNGEKLETNGDDYEGIDPVLVKMAHSAVSDCDNFEFMFRMIDQDHSLPDLIWTSQTRTELRNALEFQIQSLVVEQEEVQQVAWNYSEFSVTYESLESELNVGGCYIRLLEDNDPASGNVEQINQPAALFTALYCRFLREMSTENSVLKFQCLQMMETVYRYHARAIGVFEEIDYLVELALSTRQQDVRGCLLVLLECLCTFHPDNALLLMKERTIGDLMQFISCANFDDRAEVKEWFYVNKDSGPFSTAELREKYKNGILQENTPCWAEGLQTWTEFSRITQLRWFCLMDSSLQHHQMAVNILHVLIRMLKLNPSRDAEGVYLRPIPRAKSILGCPELCLPFLSQCLLCENSDVVDAACETMELLCDENSNVIHYLSRAGVLHFALISTAKSMESVSRLLFSIRTSNELFTLLPESMIILLDKLGPERFAEVFTGSIDSPEVIWNAGMRDHLREMLVEHLNGFDKRIKQNSSLVYQWTPVPPILFEELNNQLWCGGYYLVKLVQGSAIDEPMKLLEGIVVEWRKSINAELGCTPDRARELLHLDNLKTYSDFEIRQKFRQVANEESTNDLRTAFHVIIVGQETAGSLDLFLQTQIQLFRDFPNELSEFEYLAFDLLILITANQERETAVELIYLICVSSSINVHHLVANGGIRALLTVLEEQDHYEDHCSLVAYSLKIFVGLSALEEARHQLFELMDRFIAILSKVLKSYSNNEQCVQFVLQIISRLAGDSRIQELLISTELVWLMIPLLFKFDASDMKSCTTSKYCARAWSRLGGYLCEPHLATLPMDEMAKITQTLFSKPVEELFKISNPLRLLKVLNSVEETPFLIWNSKMKKQMLDHLALHSSYDGYVIEEIADEPFVAGVYLRLYNSNPETEIPNVPLLTMGLLAELNLGSQVILESLRHLLQHSDLNEMAAVITASDPMKLKDLFLGIREPSTSAICVSIVLLLSRNPKLLAFVCSYNLLAPVFQDLNLLMARQDMLQMVLEYSVDSSFVNFLNSSRHILIFLRVLCTSTGSMMALLSIQILSACLHDAKFGGHSAIILGYFVPRGLVKCIADQSALHFICESIETPELIWTQDMLDLLKSTLDQEPIPSHIQYPNLQTDLVIEGIYVRLFVADPQFKLSDAALFCRSLIQKFLSFVRSSDTCNGFSTEEVATEVFSAGMLILIADAICCISYEYPVICGQLANSTGFPMQLALGFELSCHIRDAPVFPCIVKVMRALLKHKSWAAEIGCKVQIENSMVKAVSKPYAETEIVIECLLDVCMSSCTILERLSEPNLDTLLSSLSNGNLVETSGGRIRNHIISILKLALKKNKFLQELVESEKHAETWQQLNICISSDDEEEDIEEVTEEEASNDIETTFDELSTAFSTTPVVEPPLVLHESVSVHSVLVPTRKAPPPPVPRRLAAPSIDIHDIQDPSEELDQTIREK